MTASQTASPDGGVRTRTRPTRPARSDRSSTRAGSGRSSREAAVAAARARPRGRTEAARPSLPVLMGVAWAVVVVVAVRTGAAATVVVLIPVGVVAAVSAVRAINETGARLMAPRLAFAVAAPVLLPIAALGGPVPAVVVAVLVAAAGGAAMSATATANGSSLLRLTLAVLAPAVAIMSLVLARSQGSQEAVALIAGVCGYDVASFIFGTGRSALGGPAGVVVGIFTVAVVAVFVAAAVVPPFSGDRPWVMFGLVAALAPIGVGLLGRVVSGARLPALRRLDSLVLSGPAWVIAAAIVLHR